MALQIRRGNESQRSSMAGILAPAPGEPLYVLDTKKVYIGDGVTTGGTSLGYFGAVAVQGQTTLTSENNRETLTLIQGTNISIATDSITNSVTISLNLAEFNTEHISITENNILGTSSNENINIDPSGTGKVVINSELDVIGNITAPVFNGSLIGPVTGDVKGSVFADDSSLIVDAVNGTLSGNLTGDVTGNITGNVLGNVTGNVLGNVTGNVLGILKGSVFSDDSTLLVDGEIGVLRGEHRGSLVTADITISGDTIQTNRSNGDIFITTSGSGDVFINSRVVVDRIDCTLDSSVSGIFLSSGTDNNAPVVILTSHNTASTSPAPVFSTEGPFTGSTMNFVRSRGDTEALLPVENNDEICTIDFYGLDALGVRSVVKIKSVITDATAGILSGKLDFYATNSTGVNGLRLSITGERTEATVPFKVASYTTTQRNSLTASVGDVIYNTTDNKFQGYQNTGGTTLEWVDLS